MSLWLALLLAAIAPLLFAITNVVDKILVGDHEDEADDSTPGALMAMGGAFNLVAFIVTIILVVCFGKKIDLNALPGLVLNGVTNIGACWLYLVAMKKDQPEHLVPWFQTVPVFGIAGGAFFLGEILGLGLILAIVAVVVGGFVLAFRDGVLQLRSVLLMVAASALYALNDVVFAEMGRECDDLFALAGDMAGKAVFGLLFLFGKRARNGFIEGIRTKGKLQAANESMFIIGDALLDLAKLWAPVALVQATCATQPVFVVIVTIVLARYTTKVKYQQIGWVKKIAIAAVVAGGITIALLG